MPCTSLRTSTGCYYGPKIRHEPFVQLFGKSLVAFLLSNSRHFLMFLMRQVMGRWGVKAECVNCFFIGSVDL